MRPDGGRPTVTARRPTPTAPAPSASKPTTRRAPGPARRRHRRGVGAWGVRLGGDACDLESSLRPGQRVLGFVVVGIGGQRRFRGLLGPLGPGDVDVVL